MFPEQLEQLRDVEPVKHPVIETRGKIIEISGSVPIFLFEKFAVVGAVLGDEVDKLLSVVEIAIG